MNAWQLVAEAREALGLPAAASFKHVSPAGAAVAVPLPEDLARAYEVKGETLSPAATAYVRARGADPKCSFGDMVALSDTVDLGTAEFLKGVVSDGIIAPGYEPKALKLLCEKKGGSFIVLQIDAGYRPPEREAREVFGVRLVQDRNNRRITEADLANVVCGSLDAAAKRDLVLGLIALKYTQSNSVGYALDGQMIGIGAGQQSRVDCTKLAGAKADVWHLGRHPKVLGLRFKKGVKRQDRINWRVRYIEGDLVPSEERELAEVLDEPLVLLTRGREARVGEEARPGGAGLGRLHPVPRQHRPRGAPRREVHRAAGRLDPRRGHRGGLPRVRDRAGAHEPAPVPPLAEHG